MTITYSSVTLAQNISKEECETYGRTSFGAMLCNQQSMKELFEKTKAEAESGDAKAQINLAKFYIEARNFAPAFKWAKLSADAGDQFAWQTLYLMYYQGKGVKKSLAESYAWANLLAERGERQALAFKEKLLDEMSWFEKRRAESRSNELLSIFKNE